MMAKKEKNSVLNAEIDSQVEEQEQFYAPKEKSNIGKIIFDVVFWVTIVALLFVWVFDFLKVNKQAHTLPILFQHKN